MTIDFRAPVRCGCGKRGCMEGLASGPAIAARAREKLAASSDGARILAAAGGEASSITDESVVKAERRGDTLGARGLCEKGGFVCFSAGDTIVHTRKIGL